MQRTSAAFLLAASVALASAPPTKHYTPTVHTAKQDTARVADGFTVPKGMSRELWAAEPLLANPVIFTIDNKGRVFVAETFRLHQGVGDIRGHRGKNGKGDWLDDDLACRTVEDRIAMKRRRLGARADSWAGHHERIRLLQDVGDTGRATKATVFADGFSRLEDGIAAGLLVRGDTVWYTCIPDLVRLRDPKGLGHATSRETVATGFGVRMGFIGHDMHGLVLGPDGRIYFSIGDRGLNVVTKEGKRLEYPDTGAVLRCDLDGSNLEVFASGLRNPQELAFDDHGNLFTGDNNSDGGDRARWVYLLHGGDCGWRIGYQFEGSQGNRGPWNAEKLDHPPFKGQAAWIVPPITNLGDGPSGLVYYPGVGLPPRYDGHFFLADFRGGPANSGIRSFANKPRGAGFELTDSHQFIWGVLATDVDFAPDGAVFVSDWVNGWGLTGRGRMWRFADKDHLAPESKRLLGQGFTKLDAVDLGKLLGHKDRRVRLEAHLELASRGKDGRPALIAAATRGEGLARLHGVWGLGIQGRKDASVFAEIKKLLADADAEVRAQACRVLGDSVKPCPELAPLLKDESPRVRSLAALALGRTGGATAADVVALLAATKDDPWLRHSAVMALTKCATEKELASLSTHSSTEARIGAVLAMRRQGSAAVARFLDDADPSIVDEAARAINDAPIARAMPALARLLPRRGLSSVAAFRALNAAYRVGTREHADAVAQFAARADAAPATRREALLLLETWAKPGGRDRVLGVWRPLPSRDEKIARDALKPHLAGIFASPPDVQKAATRAAAKLGVKEVGPALFALLRDETASAGARAEAVKALHALKDAKLDDAITAALKSEEAEVRAAGREVLARERPADALKELSSAIKSGTLRERQRAYDVLGTMKADGAVKALDASLDDLLAGKVPAEARLDLVEAAERHAGLKPKLAAYDKARPKDEPFGEWRDSLTGGDAAAGKDIFLYKSSVSCLRCHKTAGHGTGEVGPDLTGIGAKQTRAYLLESIVTPSKQIAKGYESVQLQLGSGKIVSGILKSEDAKVIRLMTPEGATVEVKKDDVEGRTPGKSAMPDDLTKHLTRREMRDLVEYLASLKEGGKK